MGQLADRLDGIRVRARAPGSEIEATLRDRTRVTMSFGESEYDFISEPALERALGSLARLLWAGWQRQYRAAIDETGLTIDADDQHDLNFLAERKEIEAVGESSDERIGISAVGMENFSVRILPGTVHEIAEDEFIASATEAASTLIHDFLSQAAALKKRYYG